MVDTATQAKNQIIQRAWAELQQNYSNTLGNAFTKIPDPIKMYGYNAMSPPHPIVINTDTGAAIIAFKKNIEEFKAILDVVNDPTLKKKREQRIIEIERLLVTLSDASNVAERIRSSFWVLTDAVNEKA